MSLFIIGLGRASIKEGSTSILIGDMDISRIMVYVQQVEKEKVRDRDENRNKMAKSWNESGKQKNGTNRPQFHKNKWHAPSSSSTPTTRDIVELHGQNSRARSAYS